VRKKDDVPREVLPIPDRKPVSLTTTMPGTRTRSFRRSNRCVRRRRPNVLIILLDDVGFGASSAFGGPCQTPTAERARRTRTEVHPLPHHRAVLAVAGGNALGPQPSRGRHGRHHGNRHLGARLQLDAPEHLRAARRDPQAQWLFHGPVRQVPRSAGLRSDPDRPVRSLADRFRLRALLRLHRRGEQPVLPGSSTTARRRSRRRGRPRRATT
jgi:hypothetical protein